MRPTGNICEVRRQKTNTPFQALAHYQNDVKNCWEAGLGIGGKNTIWKPKNSSQ